jgi:hypothetical protein
MTVYTRRSPWGLDTQPDGRNWRTHAPCGDEPDLWFTGRATLDQIAAHVCRRHCPVLLECQADTALTTPNAGVWAGVVWVDKDGGRQSEYQPKRLPCGSHCDRWRETKERS